MKRKVVIFDVDGVVARYEEGFVDWLNHNSEAQYADLAEAKRELDVASYEVLKARYRASGAKRDLAVIEPDLSQQFAALKSRGFEIVMMTSRPVQKYPNIYADTFIWLAENSLWFDVLLFAEKKHLAIQLNFASAECYVVDDDLSQVQAISSFFDGQQDVLVLYVCRDPHAAQHVIASGAWAIMPSTSRAIVAILSIDSMRRSLA